MVKSINFQRKEKGINFVTKQYFNKENLAVIGGISFTKNTENNKKSPSRKKEKK